MSRCVCQGILMEVAGSWYGAGAKTESLMVTNYERWNRNEALERNLDTKGYAEPTKLL